MKVVVITGAAHGIGLALTLQYLQKGMTVVMMDNDEEKLKLEDLQLSAQFPKQVMSLVCDVTQYQEVAKAANVIQERLGRIDLIYNNAGILGPLTPVWELKSQDIEHVMGVNLYGMIHVIRAFSPLLFAQNFHSHIINMASLYALCTSSLTASYAMSKHAVLALSESLYFELKDQEKPVDVSVIFPSFTNTNLLASKLTQNPLGFYQAFNQLLANSRPACDVATHIVKQVEAKQFYILPDKEVKHYCEERTKTIIGEEYPHTHTIEKLMRTLIKRHARH